MKNSTKIAEEILYYEYKCPNCQRIVPNWTFLTKDKCIWCDANYHWAKMKEVKKTKDSSKT